MHYNSHNKPADYNDMINTLSMNKVMQILHSSPWHHQYFGNVAYYNNNIMFINTYSYYIIPATPDDMQGYATCISATKRTDLKKIIQDIISYNY